MRMSGFILGGLVGAAVAVYFSRGNRAFSFSGVGSAGEAIDNIVEKVRSRMMAPDKRTYYGSQQNSQAASGSSGAVSGNGSTPGMEQVESIVRSDPALSSQVNDILSEGQTGANK